MFKKSGVLSHFGWSKSLPEHVLHWWRLLPFSCFKLNDLSSYFLYQIVYREWDCEVINGKSSIFGVYQGMQLYGTLALLLARTQHIERDRLRDRTLSSKGRRPRVHHGSPSPFNVDIILKPVKSYLTKHSAFFLFCRNFLLVFLLSARANFNSLHGLWVSMPACLCNRNVFAQ